MFSFIIKIYKAFKASMLLSEAWDAVASNRIEDAEECFVSINKIVPDLCAEHQIMEAYIKFRASKYRDAKELFDIAWKKIDLDEHLSSDEKLYFKGFVLGPAQMTIFFLKHRNNLEPNYNNIHKCNIYGVDLQKISKKWKTHFPMRDHPDWDKYGV